MSLAQSTLAEACLAIRRDPDASVELVEDLVKRAEAVEPKVHAYTAMDPSRVRESLGPLLSGGRPDPREKPLFGIPVSIKDNICTSGWETTCASKILRGHVPFYDATVVAKLKKAGAILFAKCNMDEFAFGSSTETSCYGPTFNPWDLERVPGGSSGGSAASVAAGEALCALGSDTGGSIRQPAAFCNVVGLKPTYGRVSRYGLVAFGSSLDQIGPLTKTVEDCALLMNVIAGHDVLDSTSAEVPCPDYTQGLDGGVKGLTIGLPSEYFIAGLDQEIEAAVRKAADTLASLGAEIMEVSLPHTPHAVAVYYIVAVAEASSNLGRFDGVRYGFRFPSDELLEMYLETRDRGFGAEAKRRILLGTFVLSAGYYDAYYLQAQKVRTLIKRDFDRAFEKVDAILVPTSPTPPFKIGEKLDDPLAMYLSDIYTIPVNLAGVPAIAIPAGFSKRAGARPLPIGMQLIGKPFDEPTLLRAAYAFEQAAGFYKQRPTL